MLVQMIYKKNGQQFCIVIDNMKYSFMDAVQLYKQNKLTNVVLVENKYFRSKGNSNIIFKEVSHGREKNDKRVRNSVEEVRTRQGKGSNKGGVNQTPQGTQRKQKELSVRGREGNIGTSRRNGSEPQGHNLGIDSSVQLRLKKLGCEPYGVVSAESFKSNFDKARLSNKNSLCVDMHDISDLRHMKCLQSSNGFVAVESDGNINSVLKDVTKPYVKNFLLSLMINALVNGASKLDCFAIMTDQKGGLADMYTRYGFIPVVKDRFNRDFAPDNWNYERDGEPDIVFMYHNGDTIEKVVDMYNKGAYKRYLEYNVPYVTDLSCYRVPPSDYDWDKDAENLSTYAQAMLYRNFIQAKAMKYKG